MSRKRNSKARSKGDAHQSQADVLVSTTDSESQSYLQSWIIAWNQFWFKPSDPALLGLLRILVGGMLFYTHFVWSFELSTFFSSSADALLPIGDRGLLADSPSYLWSHFDWIGDGLLWPVHIAGLIVFALFTLGLWTRVTGIVSALLVISYANRSFGTQFGLDQINGFMAMYLALGPSGQFASIDRWFASRKQREQSEQGRAVPTSTLANVSIRLMQVHLCVVYFFAGMGKLQGEFWWNGEAIWGALANYEYQTLDLTWLSEYMWLVNVMTYTALIWEVSYPFLIWPRLTRPLWIIMAILVHLGIGLCMGMMTFGLIMVFANFSFLDSTMVRKQLQKLLPESIH